jgi:hypothetical protein
MKGKYGGPLSVDEFFQAIYQDRAFFEHYGITHMRGVFLYFTACDENGKAVTVSDGAGSLVDGYVSAGGYHSAAEQYEPPAGTLSPLSLYRVPS